MLIFPPRRILVPFDFSDAATTAWEHARGLAACFGSSLDLVYVEESASAGGFIRRPPRLDSRLRREIKEHAASRAVGGDRIHIFEGDPVVTILRLARTRRPDLIVMGTSGRAGMDRVLMGSVAEAVTRLSPVPVLTLRKSSKPVRSVLAPINFSDYSERGFAYAAGVAAALKVPLTALHVVSEPGRCLNPDLRLAALVSLLPVEVRGVCEPKVETVAGKPIERILQAARRHGLVVLAAHRKPLLADLVLGMTVERVLRHSPVPVLSVPSARLR